MEKYQNITILWVTGIIEEGIWSSVDKHVRLVAGIHGKSELNDTINDR